MTLTEYKTHVQKTQTESDIQHQCVFDCKIYIRPLSVNEAWQGRRFKTKKYLKYETDLLFLLPKLKLPEPPFEIVYDFGLSNSCSDIDNPVKAFQDVLQKKYHFDDKNIVKMVISKTKITRGNEYITFKINHFNG